MDRLDPSSHGAARASLVDELGLARILGVDAGDVRRAVRNRYIEGVRVPERGLVFDVDAVRETLSATGWDGREPLLTAQQAAGRLGVKHSELAQLALDGKLNPVRPLPGMAARYRVSEVEAIVDGGRTRAIVAEAGSVIRVLLSNLVLLLAVLIAIFPLVALLRGSAVLASASHPASVAELIGVIFAGLALLAGGIFFCYSVRYYLATIIVLASAAPWLMRYRHERRQGRIAVARERDPSHLNLGYNPFVSIHVAAYNEERVIARLLEACEKLDYPNFEVILVDDSTDGTAEIAAKWADHPRFKILHRSDRTGFKGGALKVALEAMDTRAEYVAVFDADAVPFPDSIQRLMPHFYEVRDGRAHRKHHVAAVQSYQWHVLNKEQSWLTEAVRAEYSGSYMIERPFQQALGGMKMVAGTAYMIRSDVLRKIGWGTSITEDWELTLHLYTLGYKVAYTPFAETPAECVAGVQKLARQRMRWAEGHSFNVRKWFPIIFTSPLVSAVEKVEFAFYVTYYLQAVLLLVGTSSWLVAELGLHARIPGWTAVLGWSLVIANLLALPLMNAAGLVLEEAPLGDFRGALASIATAYILIPYQGWAALKGMFEKSEGTWVRTPKTGRLTGAIQHLRPVEMLQQWAVGLPRRGEPAMGAVSQALIRRRFMPRVITLSLLIFVIGLTAGAVVLPVTAATNSYYLHRTYSMDHAPAGGGSSVTIILSPGLTQTWTSTDAFPSGYVVPAGTYTFSAHWQKNSADSEDNDENDEQAGGGGGGGGSGGPDVAATTTHPTANPRTANGQTSNSQNDEDGDDDEDDNEDEGGGEGAKASITFVVGFAATSCQSFTNLVSWTADVKPSHDATTTSASTSHATDFPKGGPFHICFRFNVKSVTCPGSQGGGGDSAQTDQSSCQMSLVFDSKDFQAILTPPAIEVSERALPSAGIVLVIPLAMAGLARRRWWPWRR